MIKGWVAVGETGDISDISQHPSHCLSVYSQTEITAIAAFSHPPWGYGALSPVFLLVLNDEHSVIWEDTCHVH